LLKIKKKINGEANLIETTNEIGIKYFGILSIFQERLSGLQSEYRDDATKTATDFNWKELNIL